MAGKDKGKAAAAPRPLTNEARIKRNELIEEQAMQRLAIKEQLVAPYAEKAQKAAQYAAKHPGDSPKSRETAKNTIAKARLVVAYYEALHACNQTYEQGDRDESAKNYARMSEIQDQYETEIGEGFPDFDAMVAQVLREQSEKAMAVRAAKQKEAGGTK
ncbi:MAG: hypothetical protein A3K18_21310 [Lentisphaerae bacterium RIFOXYA12_64_32]|nr:MAG: hypothetical protein A3K18_21310 [Lentisphaerae bacterium RIFOXYA12_64_32]